MSCQYKKTVEPICSKKRCKECFSKSFASHEKSKYWSDNNKLTARKTLKHFGIDYKFDCPICNETFSLNLSEISSGIWCDCVGRKSRSKVLYFLMDNDYEVDIEKMKVK